MLVTERLMPLVHELESIEAVRAAAVVGSHATGHARPDSDIDLFVYLDRPHEDILGRRRDLADTLADPSLPIIVSDLVYSHTDIWALREHQVLLDVMFWQTRWADDELERMLVNHQASVGYSTAFWRSFVDAIPVFDRDGWLEDFGRRARSVYPDGLARNIIETNRSFLGPEHPFSLWNQIAGAVHKEDAVSVLHRTAAWVASYFDVVFAVNRVLHPGEKRQLAFAESECEVIPVGMSDDMRELVSGELDDSALIQHLSRMVTRLDEVISPGRSGSAEPVEE